MINWQSSTIKFYILIQYTSRYMMNIIENINMVFFGIFRSQCKYHCPDWRNFERDYYIAFKLVNCTKDQRMKWEIILYFYKLHELF